jgi:hypothetical protein
MPKRYAVAALCFLLLSLTPSLAQQSDAPPATLDVKWPKVEGWELIDPRPLPKESGPGAYSVAYGSRAPHITVTVYVYNRGLARIPDDLTDPAVRREFDGSREAIREAQRRGMYQEATEEESKPATLGLSDAGANALYTRFRLKIQDRQTVSELYVLPHKNHFVKVRITRMAEPDKNATAQLDRLYTELNKLLKP